MNPSSNRAEIFFRALALLLGLFFALCAAEIFIRLSPFKNKVRLQTEDPQSFALQPVPAGNFKVLILGDSFIKIDGPLNQRLQQEMKADGISVLNLARDGMGPFDYLNAWETKGKSLAPDMVILSYFVGNDLTGVQYFDDTQKNSKRLLEKKSRIKSLLQKSYLYRYLKQMINYRRPSPFVDWDKAEQKGMDPHLLELAKHWKMNIWFVDMSNNHPDYLRDNLLMQSKESLEAWGKVKNIIRKIDQDCKNQRASFLTVIFPAGLQIHETESFFKSLRLNWDEKLLGTEIPQQKFSAFCKGENLSCYDFLPDFKEGDKHPLYRGDEYDDHLNEAGNQRVAAKLRELIVAEKNERRISFLKSGS